MACLKVVMWETLKVGRRVDSTVHELDVWLAG